MGVSISIAVNHLMKYSTACLIVLCLIGMRGYARFNISKQLEDETDEREKMQHKNMSTKKVINLVVLPDRVS
jgi:F0F1-type ATP synthase assembly protein I